jgi:hypothetical protein
MFLTDDQFDLRMVAQSIEDGIHLGTGNAKDHLKAQRLVMYVFGNGSL